MSLDISSASISMYLRIMQFGELQGQSALTLIKSAAESTQTTQTPAVGNNLESPEPVQSDHIIDIRV